MLASLALIPAIAAYVDFARTGDVRWLMGRDGDPRQLALFLFRRRVPVNFRLCAIPGPGHRSVVREEIVKVLRHLMLLKTGRARHP